MPGETGATVVTNSCVLLFTHEAAGALCARHSPRPLGRMEFHNSGRSCRGSDEAWLVVFCRPGQAKREPGPITTVAFVMKAGAAARFHDRHWWLWVPAFVFGPGRLASTSIGAR